MTTIIKAIVAIAVVVLLLAVVLGALYIAVVAAHEYRLRKTKSDKYDQYNQ